MVPVNFSLFLILFCIKTVTGQSREVIFLEEQQLTLNSECTTSGGTLGQCTKFQNCPTERLKQTREDICFFEKKNPIVCCEKEKSVANYRDGNIKILQRIQNSTRLADKKCVKYEEEKPVVVFFVDGKKSEPRINPHMAAIGWRTWSDEIDWKCGGSLISHNFILTAAHCTTDRGSPPEFVRVGALNLLVPNQKNHPQNFTISQIYVHPDYKPPQVYNDIALLKITPRANVTLDVKISCVYTGSDVPVQNLTAMGYGTNAFAGARTNELYEGDLSYIENEICRRSLGVNRQIPRGVIESQFCAKDLEGKKDTCQGDSGGPILFRTGYGINAGIHLVGITSFGESCAGSSPGVYTRISSYIDWIESIVWSEG